MYDFKKSIPEVISLIKRLGFASEVYVLYSKLPCSRKDKDFFAESLQSRIISVPAPMAVGWGLF